jgi:hypothetical protein
MSKSFDDYILRIRAHTQSLLASPSYKIVDGLPRGIPMKGVYLFSNGSKHLYVGRSDNIRRRMGLHSRPSSAQNQATFAFKMARKKLGMNAATYKPKGSRSDLVSNPRFLMAFQAAKEEIRQMEVRFVAEADPIVQSLLEIYVSIDLRTSYNEFRTT